MDIFDDGGAKRPERALTPFGVIVMATVRPHNVVSASITSCAACGAASTGSSGASNA
jgi:hypothetical protein